MLKVRAALASASLLGMTLGFLLLVGGCDNEGPKSSTNAVVTAESVAKQNAATEAYNAALNKKKK